MKTITVTPPARRAWLGAVLPLLPAAATAATVALALANRPDAGNRGLQLVLGLLLGAIAWAAAAFLLGPDLTDVSTASSETYEELERRVRALRGRLEFLAHGPSLGEAGTEALREAERVVAELERDLRIDGDGGPRGSEYRWLLGHGYVNAWRDLHYAEDLLLNAEPPEVVFASALTNLDRLAGSQSSASATMLTRKLGELVGLEAREPPPSLLAAKANPLDRCDESDARAIVRESAKRIHDAENDAWDQLVNVRNRLYLTLALAVSITYGLLWVFLLQPDAEAALLTGATTFFLVGAAVGVFNELYMVSRPSTKGTVFDYGLGEARLLVTPVLSGLAALGGVLVTNLTGAFLVLDGNGVASSVPSLTQIFDLGEYQMGIVVAAIFGLAPGLVLQGLRRRTKTYTSQIEELAPSTPATATRSTTALAA